MTMTDRFDDDDANDYDAYNSTMQDMFFHQMQMLEEEDELAVAAAGIVIYLDEEVRRMRNARRARNRQYLLRADLLPNPRLDTPWQALYNHQNKRGFVTTMGLDPDTFQIILDSGFRDLWDSTPIPRSDTNSGGIPRLSRCSLDAAGALGLILHYLSSPMLEVSLCEIFALIPATVSRYIQFSLSLLLQTLRRMPQSRVCYLTGSEFQEQNDLIVVRHPRLTGAFGSMDGLNLPVQVSADEDTENATYNGWLHAHFVSSVFVFAAEGTIIACNLNAPGSWHDSRVAQPIYLKLQHRTPEGYYLVTDTAFPRGSNQIAGRIQAPLKQGSKLPEDEHARNRLLEFNRQLLSYRQTAEWGMRSLQGSFGRLRVPLSIHFESYRAEVLETITRLHNLRARCVGINQIRTVYMPMWTEDEQFLLHIQNTLFSDVRKNDRVSRFHISAVPVGEND
ncbi:hypothetical protein Agabi119p4_8538 [Agaricus bisporus var. burnettii]|uniref:DDE Tnp4 domain-containing protein n=1 Tax=Agaricus bisporus var. burnettii TaxID=192524 RepID=A0A8H7C684_AGABI|nr:hypothetical protein Agabi119p4_8531 [Agaricus bisporus var. burnettii]KAF7764001.1 hypothetical protein Agabi119p4_8538 [Agaricus bisporus var. burnettii]